ncbi:uncharacterized protein [Diabrotica undecimpunctata]|uniref:uncharacterized protein n=1 Tax=Diabrotica undecimpunctata TaxID=50387 RepID=UPI003B632641
MMTHMCCLLIFLVFSSKVDDSLAQMLGMDPYGSDSTAQINYQFSNPTNEFSYNGNSYAGVAAVSVPTWQGGEVSSFKMLGMDPNDLGGVGTVNVMPTVVNNMLGMVPNDGGNVAYAVAAPAPILAPTDNYVGTVNSFRMLGADNSGSSNVDIVSNSGSFVQSYGASIPVTNYASTIGGGTWEGILGNNEIVPL